MGFLLWIPPPPSDASPLDVAYHRKWQAKQDRELNRMFCFTMGSLGAMGLFVASWPLWLF